MDRKLCRALMSHHLRLQDSGLNLHPQDLQTAKRTFVISKPNKENQFQGKIILGSITHKIKFNAINLIEA